MQRAVEDLKCRLWLVVRDLVPGLVDAGEGQITVLADLTAYVAAVGGNVGVAGRVEG